MRILVTGAGGFIGSELCQILAIDHDVVGIDNKVIDPQIYSTDCIDITNKSELSLKLSCKSFDCIIHCAGLAHQKVGSYEKNAYMLVNSESTENLLRVAAAKNPNLHFIFLSSISVYGENNLSQPVSEDTLLYPSSDYALSKVDAEKRLINLQKKGFFQRLTILRLAPVYDREWAFNLERRVLAPKKIAFIKFGKGKQKISALARPNLVEFIHFLIDKPQKLDISLMNVCDRKPYRFDEIIFNFKNSSLFPRRITTITIPLFIVWFATRLIAFVYRSKKDWIHSCYSKLADDLIFDNSRMLSTGFTPLYNMTTIFSLRKDNN